MYSFSCRYIFFVIILFVSLGNLSGCEAPLRLEGVEQNLKSPIRRSDRFQAAANNGSTIVVVGNHGLVLASSNGGQSWLRDKLPDWPELIDITSCPNGLFAALALESTVWISIDNGKQWVPNNFDLDEAPQAITCDPQNHLWVVGSFSSILKSEDDGKTWEFNSLDEDTLLTNVQFIDRDIAYISGEFGTVIKSSDGGKSWQRMPELMDEFYPHDMLFIDADTGWLVGLNGEILHTNDSANTWNSQTTNTYTPLYGIEKVGEEIFVVGGEGTVLKLEENRWERIEHGKPIYLYLRILLALNDNNLLVAGHVGALHILALEQLKPAVRN